MNKKNEEDKVLQLSVDEMYENGLLPPNVKSSKHEKEPNNISTAVKEANKSIPEMPQVADEISEEAFQKPSNNEVLESLNKKHTNRGSMAVDFIKHILQNHKYSWEDLNDDNRKKIVNFAFSLSDDVQHEVDKEYQKDIKNINK